MVLVFRQSFENRSKLMWACNTVPTHTFTNDGHKTGNFMSYSFSFVNRSLYVLDKTRTAAKCAKYAKVQKVKKQVHRARNCFFFSLSLCSFLTISSPRSGLGCYISLTGNFCSSTTETPSKNNATNEKFELSNEEK